MRITVFGATGRTGRHLLAAGLRRDHQLTAFTAAPKPWSTRRRWRPSSVATDGTRRQFARQSTVRTR
jgi:uncharacterized protein YbjT (DUF2867 family)